HVGRLPLAAGTLTASVLLVAVAATVGVRPFVGRRREGVRSAREGPPSLWLGPAVLSLLSIVLGVGASRLGPMIEPAVGAVAGDAVTVHLQIWHGLNLVFILSLLTLAAGVVLYFVRGRLQWLHTLDAKVLPWG